MDKETTWSVKMYGHARTMKKYICEYCGKEFEGRTDAHRKYCARECADLARRKPGVRVKGQHAFHHTCEQCGKDYWNLKTKSRYCSTECQRKARIGEKSPLYKEGSYIYKYKHILSGNGGYVIEHRQMVENAIGRKLERNEDVHHINQDKLDNRLENLALLSNSDHARIHHYLRGNGKLTEEDYLRIIDAGRRKIANGKRCI